MTTGSTQVMSENVSHSLFHIDTSPKYIYKKKVLLLFYSSTLFYSLYLLLILTPFLIIPSFLTLFCINSIIPHPFYFLLFICESLSLSISPSLSLSVCVSLSFSSFLLCSHALTFFLYCYLFHFLPLSFVLSFSPCTISLLVL